MLIVFKSPASGRSTIKIFSKKVKVNGFRREVNRFVRFGGYFNPVRHKLFH